MTVAKRPSRGLAAGPPDLSPDCAQPCAAVHYPYTAYPQVADGPREVLMGHLQWLTANVDNWLTAERGPSLAMVSEAVLKTCAQLAALSGAAALPAGADEQATRLLAETLALAQQWEQADE